MYFSTGILDEHDELRLSIEKPQNEPQVDDMGGQGMINSPFCPPPHSRGYNFLQNPYSDVFQLLIALPQAFPRHKHDIELPITTRHGSVLQLS